MIKILYIVSTLKRSGPTNQLYNLVKFLKKDIFSLHIVTLSPEPVDSRWNDFQDLSCSVETLGLSRFKGFLFAKLLLNKLVLKTNPQIIHTQGIRSDLLSAHLNIPSKKIATMRNYPQFDYPMTYGTLPGKVMTISHTRALKTLDLCVGVSDSVSENLRSTFKIYNLVTIQNGVDTLLFSPSSYEDKKRERQKLGLPKNGNIWISSGHLSERKNPLLLISAWRNIFKDDPYNYLLFIGTGPLYETCIRVCNDMTNVLFHGRVTNVPEYLRASDYFISASKSEGFPNSVLEALACGLPVVLSDIPPHREIWEMSKSIGSLFKKDSKNDLIQSLEDVRRQKKDDMSFKARNLIKSTLSAESMSKKYHNLYERLLKQ